MKESIVSEDLLTPRTHSESPWPSRPGPMMLAETIVLSPAVGS